jgi:hypothetical protein
VLIVWRGCDIRRPFECIGHLSSCELFRRGSRATTWRIAHMRALRDIFAAHETLCGPRCPLLVGS